MSEDKVDNCIFCRITRGEEKTELHFQDEHYAVFDDRKPAAKFHLLVCPKKHIINAKVLTKDDIALVEDLVSIAKRVLEDKGADLTKLKLGFHWPPFCTVQHLHLHAITPTDDLGFISKGIYAAGTPWFAPVEWVLDRLNKMPTAQASAP